MLNLKDSAISEKSVGITRQAWSPSSRSPFLPVLFSDVADSVGHNLVGPVVGRLAVCLVQHRPATPQHDSACQKLSDTTHTNRSAKTDSYSVIDTQGGRVYRKNSREFSPVVTNSASPSPEVSRNFPISMEFSAVADCEAWSLESTFFHLLQISDTKPFLQKRLERGFCRSRTLCPSLRSWVACFNQLSETKQWGSAVAGNSACTLGVTGKLHQGPGWSSRQHWSWVMPAVRQYAKWCLPRPGLDFKKWHDKY